MLSQLQRSLLAYGEALARETADRPTAMRRASARIRAVDAERERRQDERRAELAMLSDEELLVRARQHALPVSPWRAGLIEEIAGHEVRTELTIELLGEGEGEGETSDGGRG